MPLSDKTKQSINDVASPLAAGATILVFVLIVMEYFRHGFVSDFLDLRLPVFAAIIFCAVAASVAGEAPQSRFWEKVFAALVLLFAIYVIINLSLPWGRLGLAVIAASILSVLFLLISLKPKT